LRIETPLVLASPAQPPSIVDLAASRAERQVDCAICGLPVDPGLGGIPVDGEWVHWTRCVAEYERDRRPDPPSLPRKCVIELFARAGGRQAQTMTAPRQAPIGVLAIRSLKGSGTVEAFVDLLLGGVSLKGCKTVQQDGPRAWLAIPSVKLERGWQNVVEITKYVRQSATDALFAAWERRS
jgi:hypothetical protein